MRFQCQHVSASSAGDEIFQVLFEKEEERYDKPYLLIQRAWLEEDEGEFSPICIETQDEDLIGHYPSVDAVLTRNHLTLRLPSPANETIEVEFKTSAANFQEVGRMLGIILQKDMTEHGQGDANKPSEVVRQSKTGDSPR